MRNSCNGCRVLRKGCDDKCVIRPCLQWIKSLEAQANATLFLAKFFGRAGLLNLITSGPEHFRPAIFRSLLYEACGRVVNPVYGATGLMRTGNWHLCETAVESALQGEPISQIPIHDSTSVPAPPLKSTDIRHVSRESSEPSDKLHKVAKNRTRFKQSVQKPKPAASSFVESGEQESEGSHVSQAEPDLMESWSHDCEVGLDLTLRLAPPV